MTKNPQIHDRASEAAEIFFNALQDDLLLEGDYNALGSLITDATLARDLDALNTITGGLRNLYGIVHDRHPATRLDTGRLLGLLDVARAALRRL